MKSFILVVPAILSGAHQAIACSLPPDLTYIQPSQIISILQDQEVTRSLRAAGGKNIQSIEHAQNMKTAGDINKRYGKMMKNLAK